METAYDMKELSKRLKEAGLTEAEDAAGGFYAVFKQWVKESAPLSKTPIDDVFAPFLDHLDVVVLPQIDKIDGKEG